MRDMFYNYEHDINKKDFPMIHFDNRHKISENYHGLDYVWNAAGDILGVKADRNSTFDVYFYLDGEVEGGTLEELIDAAEFYLEIFNAKGKVIESLEAEKSANNTLKITVEANDSKLPNGIYKLRLNMTYENQTYTLFKENDAILYIE